jgi:hypothetical protein
MTDDDLIAAIMMAYGFAEDDALDVDTVAPSDIPLKSDPLSGIPKTPEEMTKKEWLSLAERKGLTLGRRERDQAKPALRQTIITKILAQAGSED